MPLIIEDGTGVTNANSYATVAEAQAFAESRGITSLANDDIAEQKLLIAMDYLDTFESQYAGTRSYVGQVIPFPRQDLIVNGDSINLAAIPWQVKKAQILLAIEAANGVSLFPTIDAANSARVKKEKVGPLEVEYENSVEVGYVSFPQVDALLAPLFGSIGYGLKIRRG